MARQSRTTEMMDAPIQRLLQQADVPGDVVSLGQGVPFFGPPDAATAAAAKALSTPDGYRYSHDAGHPGLRQAVAGKLRRDNDIAADWERNVIATAGANQAFVNAVLAVTDVGDSVVMVTPYYFNHVMAVQMAGCRPVYVPAGENYVPEVDDIAGALRPDTRAVVTISPNNPTGAVYPPATLRGVNELCADHDIYHISDEPYEHFVYDDARHVSPASYDAGLDHTISLFSFSKSYGMSGYRIGAMAVPADLYSEVLKVQDTVAICPPGPSQAAAAAALQDQGAYPRLFLPTLTENRQVFIDGMADLDGMSLPVTRGAFYFLLQLDTDRSAWDIALRLIEEYGVVTIPGEAFAAAQPALRVAYGNITLTQAREGMRRLAAGLPALL
ncbi:MAG: aminotransferase class I/II-fold pyridoxal phosphate-dependent enzyme [Candidatus Thermoplasmatota archaeon]|nr:aminotransferase class I/II-fold pyridoxal phosphate-dependent enzyme [Candidatus Thermoplasmatota archaeon]